jgi:CBS domain-containing protein
MKIEALLQKKGTAVVTIKPGASLLAAMNLLREHGIGCLVVSADGKHVDGLVAVRDIVYAMAAGATKIREARGADLLNIPVDRVMTRDVWTCTPRDTLRHVMMEMTQRHILHVPVVDDGLLCGIVSNDDVVKYAVGQMEMERAVLQDSVLMLKTLDELR